ncbi:hypothetical protein FACS189418_8650 [Clostridia bacterium]|nr:hypothetical protein FACS189418_8650 [Clostridia bacterium]
MDKMDALVETDDDALERLMKILKFLEEENTDELCLDKEND